MLEIQQPYRKALGDETQASTPTFPNDSAAVVYAQAVVKTDQISQNKSVEVDIGMARPDSVQDVETVRESYNPIQVYQE